MTTTTTCTITTSTITSTVLAELPSAGEAAAARGGARKAVG